MAKTGEVPGYFIISATDINAQPEFVENQLFILLQLTLAKMPHENLLRLSRLCSNGHNQFRAGRPRNPYYIQTLYKEYGVSGRMHYNEFKTAVLNATTGEVNVYDSQKPQVSLMRRLLAQRRIA